MKKAGNLGSLSCVTVILAFLLAQIPFSLAEWVAIGTAPGNPGIYNIIIQATHNNTTGTFPLEIVVNDTIVPYTTEGLTVEPVYPIDRTNPIRLRYEILVNNSTDFTLVASNLSVYLVAGDTLLKSENESLYQDEDGYWVVDIDVPLKGEYKAVLAIELEKDGVRYGGQFITNFLSDNPSPQLMLRQSLDKRVMITAEQFEVYMEAYFEEGLLPDLEIFKAYVYGSLKDLEWDASELRYSAEFTAPTVEGIYPVNIYAEDQDFMIQEAIYVADLSKAKSGRCPIVYNMSCGDMKDMRKCVSDYKSDTIVVTEEQLMICYLSAYGAPITPEVICEANYKGDLDGDEQLDADDLEMLSDVILPMTESAREVYRECADYDLDGDIDTSDLICLTNVIATKWHGDFHGGVCFDAEYDTPLACDLTGDQFIQTDDGDILDKLVTAAGNGISMSSEALGTCDFNQDGAINQVDRNCLNYFVGMEFANPATLLAAGQTIPQNCMAIYNLSNCQGIKGDLNGDLLIDAIDEVLIMLIYAGQVAEYDLECADVNSELGVTLEDVECVKSYVAGDRDAYFICIGCTDETPPAHRAPYEICGDSYDNNCDGLTDRTSEGADDWCICGDHTPCWVNWDADTGTVPGIDDGNVYVCRKVSWDNTSTATSGNVSGYRWSSPLEFICDSSRECETVECDQTLWKCAFDGLQWSWYERPSDLPVESDDPLAAPKLCEDTYDNDCACGDQECKELEAGNMFSSWEFWVGLVLGAVCGWFLGPIAVILISLLATALSMVASAAGWSEGAAFLSGFAMGVGIGNMAHGAVNALSSSGAQATTTTTATATTTTTTATTTTTTATTTATTAATTSTASAVMTAVKDFLTTAGTQFFTQHWIIGAMAYGVAYAAAGYGTQQNAMDYAESEAEWQDATPQCSD